MWCCRRFRIGVSLRRVCSDCEYIVCITEMLFIFFKNAVVIICGVQAHPNTCLTSLPVHISHACAVMSPVNTACGCLAFLTVLQIHCILTWSSTALVLRRLRRAHVIPLTMIKGWLAFEVTRQCRSVYNLRPPV